MRKKSGNLFRCVNQVSEIIEDVKENKDEACRRYTKQFDGVDQKTFRVTEKELDEAIQQCDPGT